MKKPIVYHGTIETRFGETDMYGHINSKHYLDYVCSMRLSYLEKSLGVSQMDLIKKNIGFFLTRTELNYKRSIAPGSTVNVLSQIEEIQGSHFTVSFRIEDLNGKKVFADGQLTFCMMDLSIMRPQSPPDWVNNLFYVEEEAIS